MLRTRRYKVGDIVQVLTTYEAYCGAIVIGKIIRIDKIGGNNSRKYWIIAECDENNFLLLPKDVKLIEKCG